LALSQYQEIIDHHNDGIYIDEALFFSAEIYNKKVERNRKRPLYEKIIFNPRGQYLLCGSQKNFRQLRGDINL
jgi:hypothetical protein